MTQPVFAPCHEALSLYTEMYSLKKDYILMEVGRACVETELIQFVNCFQIISLVTRRQMLANSMSQVTVYFGTRSSMGAGETTLQRPQ